MQQKASAQVLIHKYNYVLYFRFLCKSYAAVKIQNLVVESDKEAVFLYKFKATLT